MCDHRNFDGREKVFAKVSAFSVIPCEAFVLEDNEVVKEVALGWPQEVRWV